MTQHRLTTTERNLVFALAAVLASQRAAADAFTTETNKIKDICTEHEYLKQLQNKIATAATAETEAVNELHHLRKLWRTQAGTAQDHRQRCLLLALEADAEAEMVAAQAQLKSAKAKYKAAELEISKHLGRLETAMATAKFTIKEDATARAAKGGQGNAELYFVLKPGGNRGCEPRGTNDPDPFQADPLKTDKITNLKLTNLDKLHENNAETEVTITASSSGCPNDGGSLTSTQQRLASCNIGAGAAATFATTTSKTTTAQETTEVFKENARTTSCQNTHAATNDASPAHKKLAKKICEALEARRPTITAMRTYTGQTLADKSSTRKLIRNCDPTFQTIDDADDNAKAKELTDYIKKAYGESPNDFSKNFIENLENQNVQTRQGRNAESKKVSDLIASSAIGPAITHSEGQRIQRELEAEKKVAPATADSKNEEKCKGKPVGECKDKDGCVFKEGKCVAKVTTTTATDGKTNTTTSHSFVIKTSPLLLSVLLF
uniref:Variant surface glycoprotein 532 n=1 Tax=Trypanosoma brucei TaxID=5691 RepID=M4TDF7_9TRYP|nr:variant surface glycoprotein 532 [Trypanosoma brucei]